MYIHPFFYLVLFISFITGNFNSFILFFFIIFFHELGHISGAIYFKWKIDQIIIMPFGGLTVFNVDINRPLKEEFIICLLGPLFQIIYYLIFKDIFDIKNIHYNLLVFNLLPIFPLDGSKIFNIIFNKVFSFKLSLYVTYIISFIVISVLFITNQFNLLLFLTLILLFFKNIKELKNIKYIFNRFLLERYFKYFNFKKRKVVKSGNVSKMKKDYYHLFFVKNKYATEREMLKKMFDLKSFL